MQRFEYRVVPAPRKGEKAKGVKTSEDRFAHALTRTMNDMAAQGWDYLRTDTLPLEERVGFTGRTTTFQHMLVFRRSLDVQQQAVVRSFVPAPMPGFDDVEEPASLPDLDPMDQAARRVALTGHPDTIPPARTSRVELAAVPGQAPPVGPARGAGTAGQAAE